MAKNHPTKVTSSLRPKSHILRQTCELQNVLIILTSQSHLSGWHTLTLLSTNQLQGQVRHVGHVTRRSLSNQVYGTLPHVAGDYQEGAVLQPLGNVATQGEIQYPPYIDAPTYNVVLYHPPPPPVRDGHRCDNGFPFWLLHAR